MLEAAPPESAPEDASCKKKNAGGGGVVGGNWRCDRHEGPSDITKSDFLNPVGETEAQGCRLTQERL